MYIYGQAHDSFYIWIKHKRDWTLVNLKTLFEDVTNRNNMVISIKDSKTLKPLTSSLFFNKRFIHKFHIYIKHWTGKFCKHKQAQTFTNYTHEHQSLILSTTKLIQLFPRLLKSHTNICVKSSRQYKMHEKQKWFNFKIQPLSILLQKERIFLEWINPSLSIPHCTHVVEHEVILWLNKID